MKIIIFFCLLSNFLFSNTFTITNNSIQKISLTPYIQTYMDKINLLDLEQIKNRPFDKLLNTNFKASKNSIWIKFSIFNNNQENKQLYFENSKAGIDIINVYIFQNNKLIKNIELGDMRDIKKRELKTKKSAFFLDIQKNSSYDFFIEHKSYSSISTLWHIYDKQTFEKSETLQSLAWGIFVGIILTLTFYNLVLFFSIKEFAFLNYILMSLSFAIYQLNVNGVVYQLFENINLQYFNNLNWTVGYLAQAFAILFPISFFKPPKKSLVFIILFIVLIANICAVIFYCFAFENPELRYYTKYTDFITFLTIPCFAIVTIWGIKNRRSGAIFYLFGQAFYLTLILYVLMVTIGYFESFDYIWTIVTIGIILDVIFLSLALFMKIKDIEREKKVSEQFILSQARFTAMGNNIANMVHQWKNPIAQIGSQITLLETTYNLDKKNFNETLKNTLPQIKESILFLKHIMNDIYNFYKNPISKEYFDIENEIDSLLRILDNELKMNNILVKKDIKPFEFYGYKSSFLNIIMIILENSIYQLKNFREENKRIFIFLEEIENSKMVLKIEDNGGGIENYNLKRIFDLDFSSKKEKGSGLGLALAKELVEKRLGGKISVQNTIVGVSFVITFNQNSNTT